MSDKIQKEFEEWATIKPAMNIDKDGDGEYEDIITNYQYYAFEAGYKKGVWAGAVEAQKQCGIDYDELAELTKLREERKAMCWALTSIRSMSQPGAVLNPAKTIETIRNIANDAVEALAKYKKDV